MKPSDLTKFVREHSDWMMAVAFRILLDRGHAEDAVQAAFINVFKHLDSFEGRSSLQSWMRRIVVNEALMVLRKIKRQNEQSIDNLLPSFDSAGCRIEPGLVSTQTPESLLVLNQTHKQIRAAITQLPEDYRLVLCLRDIEGLSTKESSEALAISEANVKMRLHRARSALKKLLEPLVKEKRI